MPTNDDLILFDTSAALAFVDTDSPFHSHAWGMAVDRPRGLSGHAVFEFLSVVTRLPLPKRLTGQDALRLLRSEFPQSRFLPPDVADGLPEEFTRLGIVGGMVYDGLVGACARHHDLTLLTADRRAEDTYRALAVRHQFLDAR